MENSSNLPQKQCPDLTLDEAMEHEMKDGRVLNDPNIDLKKIRRNISNRLSAQRSRSRMVNHTRDLEKMVKDLEYSLISILTPQVEIYTEKNRLLQLENDSLRQQLEKLSIESRSKKMEIEEKRVEIKMLKELQKTAQKNKYAADSETEQIPADFYFEQLNVADYPSIDFYQLCLQNQQETSSSAVVPNMAPDSAVELSGEEIKPVNEAECNQQEFEDVDQYINFDALDATDPFCD